MSTEPQTRWRESASLIIAVPSKVKSINDRHDYNLLLFKRSVRTAMMKNQCVFPGGIVDAADEAIEWMQYFEEFGVTQQALKLLVVISDERPRILQSQGTGCYDRFFKQSKIWAREISLRITAIRETFEEVGVLLCRTKSQFMTPNEGRSYFLEDFERATWQKIVHNEPSEFLRLCRELKVLPDLWSLYEWSAWASPAPLQKGYEAAFFITFLNKQPNLMIEESEVQECLWHSPELLLRMFIEGSITFMPPQVYELSRFFGVKSYDELAQFARNRSLKGTTLFLPVMYMCSDNVVSVLPGDDFYVMNPRDSKNLIPFEGTVEQFRASSKKVHRAENVGTPDMVIHLNFEPWNGHLPPIKFIGIQHKL